jgi:hypothetical protein
MHTVMGVYVYERMYGRRAAAAQTRRRWLD